MEKVKILTHLDYFSSHMPLNINGQSAYKTKLGVLVTLIYLGCLLTVTVDQVRNFFDLKNPIAVTDAFSASVYPQVKLLEQKFMPIFVAYSNETDLIPPDKMAEYFTIAFNKIGWRTVEDGLNLQKEFDNFPAVPCSELSEEERQGYDYIMQDEYTNDLFKTYAICGKVPLNISVEGKGSDPYFSFFTLKVLPCSLSSGCRSYTEILEANFQIILPTSNYDSSKSSSPLSKLASYDEVYYVHPFNKQMYSSKIRSQKVIDLLGAYPVWRETSSAFEIGATFLTNQYRQNVTKCTQAQIEIPDNQECLPYFEYTLQSSGIVAIYRRSYATIFETLGNIGGTTQIVFLFLLLLYSPIDEYRRRKYVLEKVYPLLGEKDIGLGKQEMELVKPSKESNNFVEEKTDQSKGAGSFIFDKDSPVPYESNSKQSNSLLKKTTSRISNFFHKNSLLGSFFSKKLEKDEEGRPDPNKEKAFKSRTWKEKLLCCRKKTEDELLYEARVKDALDRIDSTLDVTNILRYFNLIVVMSHFFLEDQHLELAQYVGFDLWRQRQNKQKERECQEEKSSKKKNRIEPAHCLDKEKDVFHKSLEKLQEKKLEGNAEIGKLDKDIKSLISNFYYDHLFGQGVEDIRENNSNSAISKFNISKI